MTPDVTDTGHSFKGAFSYYLHDKRAGPGQPPPTTAERVAWTETRNLATDSPEMAWRIMRATAAEAETLKRAAGVAATGRKAKGGPVFAYSLAWRSDEAAGVSREDMARAAVATLKHLKADHLQAVIVCHRDTANPHVHIIVNRVDPATGKTHPFGQSQTKLSDWAARYERDRGMIVTPKRQEAAAAREAARKRPSHDDDAVPQWVKRKRAEESARHTAPAPPRIDGERPKPTARTETPGARLKALHDAQNARHAAERAKLWTDQKARRTAILEASRCEIRERVAAAKVEGRPLWADLYREQREARRAFEARERHISGKVKNAIEAVTNRQIRGDGSDAGFLTMAWGYLRSRDARAQELGFRQARERQQLSEAVKDRLDSGIGQVKEARERQLAKSRAAFTDQSADLKKRQRGETADIRAQWKALYAERERTAQNGGRDRAAVQLRAKTARRDGRAAWTQEQTARAEVALRYMEARQQRAARQQERGVVKNDFERARRFDATARPIPNRAEMLSRPAPVPSPSGDVPPAKRTAQPVPMIDKAEAWAKRHQQEPAAAPQLREAWRSRAPSAQPAPVAPKAEKWANRHGQQSAAPQPREAAPRAPEAEKHLQPGASTWNARAASQGAKQSRPGNWVEWNEGYAARATQDQFLANQSAKDLSGLASAADAEKSQRQSEKEVEAKKMSDRLAGEALRDAIRVDMAFEDEQRAREKDQHRNPTPTQDYEPER